MPDFRLYHWSSAVDALTKLADSITVSAIMTPTNQLDCADASSDVPSALAFATDRRYDQLPIKRAPGNIVGLAFVDALRVARPGDGLGSLMEDFHRCSP